MKVELTNEEIKGIIYAINRSDAKEIINKYNQNLEPTSKGLYSAEYKLNELLKKIHIEEAEDLNKGA